VSEYSVRVEEFIIGAAVALASALVGAYAESSFQRKRDRKRVQAAAKLLLMELGDLRAYAARVLGTDTASIRAIDVVRPDSVERSAWETHRHSIVEVGDERTVKAIAAVYGDCFETLRTAGTVGAKMRESETGIREETRLTACIEKIKTAEERLLPLAAGRAHGRLRLRRGASNVRS
jgi:hypothetical protein